MSFSSVKIKRCGLTLALTTKCQYINNSCFVREGLDDEGANKEKNRLSVSLKKFDEPLHSLLYSHVPYLKVRVER